MGGSKAPPAPDYVGAANAQGAANLEAAIATGKINNPNVNNPYGTQTVTWDGQSPTITQTLAPDQQKILDYQNQAKMIGSNAGVGLAGQVAGSIGKPLDYNALPKLPTSANQTRDDVVKAMMARLDTDTAGQRDAKNSELIAAGIRPGTRAYDSAMGLIDRQYNDARNNAILAGGQQAAQDYSQDMGTRQQAINEMLQQRDTPINELNALVSGSQVSNPFAGGLGYQGGAQVGAAPIAGAVTSQGQAQQNIYNQAQSQQNGNIAAGAGLLGSLGQGYLSGRSNQ